ncbi:MAG: phosphoenolpyruvate synthase regulatory protein [Alkaliphilus sp.]|nr:kinase/pyrophosphorylase [bacterium AH-315-G05]PHS36425.1 MAG: phosphoenolpyruvate synthase regulatory protein [Alkaliphilus sp.]
MSKERLIIYIISDSIGETAEQVAKAGISQFDFTNYEIRRYPHMTDKIQLTEIIDRAKDENALIIFTMVVNELSEYITDACSHYDIPYIDVMSPVIYSMSHALQMTPKKEAGLHRKLDATYFRRIAAIEFAVKYDDGKDPRGLKKADLILVGISRTSKTPLSMYLAHKKIKVANVPLVPEVQLAKELLEVNPKKIIGLTTDPVKLTQIRQERLKALGLKQEANYASMERILEEMDYSEKVMKRLNCPVIDVSTKAVEESASIIMEILREIGYEIKNSK